MIYLKNLLKSCLTSIVFILISNTILTLLNYFNLLSEFLLNIFIYIILFIAFFIGALMLGKKCNNKGFLEGIKFSLIFIIMFSIINLVLKLGFNTETIITYLIILISSIIGSVLGINFKKK